jgi:methyl-accepting chemotaxis protein
MMKSFKISTRLYFLVGLALAVFTAAAVYKLYDSQESMVAGAQGQAQCAR